MNHEPEDLPGELTDVPSWPGELARMSCGCNPQGLSKALGIFYFQHVENGFQLRSRFSQRLEYGNEKRETAVRLELRPCREAVLNVSDGEIGRLGFFCAFYGWTLVLFLLTMRCRI